METPAGEARQTSPLETRRVKEAWRSPAEPCVPGTEINHQVNRAYQKEALKQRETVC